MEAGTDFRVTIDDVRACKLCFSGARLWIAEHGFVWNDFLDNGLPASTVIAINDAYGNRCLEHARKRLRIA